jgi:hypothetical protein
MKKNLMIYFPENQGKKKNNFFKLTKIFFFFL